MKLIALALSMLCAMPAYADAMDDAYELHHQHSVALQRHYEEAKTDADWSACENEFTALQAEGQNLRDQATKVLERNIPLLQKAIDEMTAKADEMQRKEKAMMKVANVCDLVIFAPIWVPVLIIRKVTGL